jgi:hypothetical protein
VNSIGLGPLHARLPVPRLGVLRKSDVGGRIRGAMPTSRTESGTRREPYHVRPFGCSRRGLPGRNSRRPRDAGVRPVPTTSQPRWIGLRSCPLGSNAHLPANWALQLLAQSPFQTSLSPCPNRPDWAPKLNVCEHKLLRRVHSGAIPAVQKAKSAVPQACANLSCRRLLNWEETVQP